MTIKPFWVKFHLEFYPQDLTIRLYEWICRIGRSDKSIFLMPTVQPQTINLTIINLARLPPEKYVISPLQGWQLLPVMDYKQDDLRPTADIHQDIFSIPDLPVHSVLLINHYSSHVGGLNC